MGLAFLPTFLVLRNGCAGAAGGGPSRAGVGSTHYSGGVFKWLLFPVSGWESWCQPYLIPARFPSLCLESPIHFPAATFCPPTETPHRAQRTRLVK